jgi:hypothetical protein
MSPLVAAAVGLSAGVHCATWGMFKDAPFEGFTWRTWVRSPIVGTLIALALTQGLRLDFGSGAAAVVVLWGVTYGLERASLEIWKGFLREEDQSKYTIPMQFAVGGKVVHSRAARLLAGAAYLALGLAVLFGVHTLQTWGPDLPRLLAVFLVASPGGWISAFGGAWKDAPIEGFHTFKFFRSPLMTFGYGLALSLLTESYVFLFLGSVGYTVATIETYKTFFFPNKKRGKFQGKTPTHPEHLRSRWRFAPLFAAIWLGVIGTAVAAFTGY